MRFITLKLAITILAFTLSAEQNPDNKVLLVYESTKFKTNLISEMEQYLTDKNVTVATATHSKKDMNISDPHQYSAIFITNSGVNSKVRPWVLDWLKQTDYKNILLHTTQTRDWAVETDFDAVTSASSNSEVKELAQDYSEKLLGFLSESEKATKESSDDAKATDQEESESEETVD